jgi:hypothetical protein
MISGLFVLKSSGSGNREMEHEVVRKRLTLFGIVLELARSGSRAEI